MDRLIKGTEQPFTKRCIHQACWRVQCRHAAVTS